MLEEWGRMVSVGLVRKDHSGHSERLSPSSLGEGGRDAFPSLSPGEWDAKVITNKD